MSAEDSLATVHVCRLAPDPRRYYQAGSGSGAHLLIIGEAPAANGWRHSGRAFYTVNGRLLPTGQRLNELLIPLGLSVEHCAFTELIKCYTGNRPLRACATGCWPTLEIQVGQARPRLILLLGKRTHELMNGLVLDLPAFMELGSVTIAGHYSSFVAIAHPSPVSPTSRGRNRELFDRVGPQLKACIDDPSVHHRSPPVDR